MVHYGYIAEGYYDQIMKLLDYFHGKEYANGKAKVRCRIMLPLHFGMNECGAKEFMADIKSFTENYEKEVSVAKKRQQTGIGAKRKMRWMIKWLFKFFPQLEDFSDEICDSKDNKLRKKLADKGEHFIVGLHPVGKMKDYKDDFGVEVV